MRYLLLALAGAVSATLAWSELPLFPLIFTAWIPLFLLEEAAFRRRLSGRAYFGYCYVFFLIWNIAVTWWVKNASFAGSVLAFTLNSLFMCVPLYVLHRARLAWNKTFAYVAFIAAWLAFEYLHLNWELSWPWLTLGNVFAHYPALVQWYEYTGVAGGTLWVLLLNILICEQALHFTQKPPLIRNFTDAIKAYIQLVWKPALLFLLPVLVSLAIYYSYSEQGKAIEVAVLQPNIDPYNEKFEPQLAQQQLERFIQLSDSICTEHTTYIVWPETSIPNSVWRRDFFQELQSRRIAQWLQQRPQLQLVAGLTLLEYYTEGKGKTATARPFRGSNHFYDAFNAAVQMQGTQQPQFYYKSKLVPGVERMPYPFLFKFLDNFAIDLGGIAGSLGTQTERTAFIGKDGIGVAPVICYESIYGEYCTEYIKKGANAIFIITNDGWWGNTPGHRQHLHYASLRAIETRRDIARSANTGISCFIDQRGIIRQATNYDEEKVIKDTLYANEALTFYVRFGDYIYKIACGAGVVLILLLIIIKKSNRRNLSRTV